MEKKHSANFVIIIPIIIAMFNIFLVLNPTEMVSAGREGLLLWFNQVLPTLLPFVVGANLLAALGFIHFMGALAAPIMVPIFKVPGAGAYALLTGLTSGYPMGAKAVAHLRETRQVTQQEAQRLISFCNNAGPLFVVGFVGAGLLGSVRLGYILLASHIIAALVVGFVFRFIAGETFNEETPRGGISSKRSNNKQLKQAFEKFNEFRQSSYAGFGRALGQSVSNAMESMVLVGGYIIVFCVVIKALEIGGLFSVLGRGSGFAAGLLEVANGAKMLAQGNQPNPMTLAAISAIISFGGLSVHGQTAHFIRETDIKFGFYLAAKLFHALLSGIICLIIV